MMKAAWFIILWLATYTLVDAQWKIMPNSPDEEGIFRFDDVFFSSERHGSLISPNGNIYTTWDGGESWTLSTRVNAYLRAIEYADSLHGLASSLQGPMVRTIDGGRTWEDITSRIPGDAKGMCGLHYVDGRYYGVGVFHAPARFFRSLDMGDTWEVFELDSIAFGLVDVHFTDSLHGFIFGTGPENAQHPEAGTIWYTSDGGDHWQEVGSTGRANTYIWKMFFATPDTVYASVENYLGTTPAYMVSYDGGQNWEYREIPLGNIGFFDAQALGFADANKGWLAGYGLGMYETIDGGNTWKEIPETANINRFFKIGEDRMLAAGLRLYTYETNTAVSPAGQRDAPAPPHAIIWQSANPVTDGWAQWEIQLDAPTYALMGIYDRQGRLVQRMEQKYLAAGRYAYQWDASALPTGMYYLSLRTYERHLYVAFVR
jgi:photosystem II stability/assembly factor-like uncharacterized protein